MATLTSPSAHRTTAAVLMVGSVLFLAAAGMPVQDQAGHFIYGLPLREQLAVIAAGPGLWQWTNSLFMAGALVSVGGLALLTETLAGAGERRRAGLGLLAAVVAAPLLVSYLAFRSWGGTWAAEQVAQTGQVPEAYVVLDQGARGLFLTYSVLSLVAAGLYGWALLRTGLLPRSAVWVALAWTLGWAGYLAVTGDLPPFIHYLTLLLWAALLLRRPGRLAARRVDPPAPQPGTAPAGNAPGG